MNKVEVRLRFASGADIVVGTLCQAKAKILRGTTCCGSPMTLILPVPMHAG